MGKKILSALDELTKSRKIACEDPEEAYHHALHRDNAPRDDTRESACRDPKWAFQYAHEVDKSPRDDTRKSACSDPRWAYLYACSIDKVPRDDTREAYYINPSNAFSYAKEMDKIPILETYKFVLGTKFQKEYENFFNIGPPFFRIKEDLESLRKKEPKRRTPIC